VRLDHLCEEFDFKNSGQKALTVEELESMRTVSPTTADGLSAWAKRNANR
jgi:hypothetical protein